MKSELTMDRDVSDAATAEEGPSCLRNYRCGGTMASSERMSMIIDVRAMMPSLQIKKDWRYQRGAAKRTIVTVLPLVVMGLLLIACRPQQIDLSRTATPDAPLRTTRAATATSASPSPAPTSLPQTQEISPSPTPFTPPDLGYLATAFQKRLDSFDGIASYTLIDLQHRQSIALNADLAISGMSIVKIPILVETYRALDEPPTPLQTRLITETATLSGNYTANLLLELIAGRPDAFAGAEVVTKSLRRLGLFNTFIAVPYDEKARSDYLPTYGTPANQRDDLTTQPDPSMQTTVQDMARLLQMIYDCSQGQGVLLQLYEGQLTQRECNDILEVMQANNIDAFLEAGVPADVRVAHKHGWVGDTHGDAGIVFVPGSPFALALALHRPGWLEWADSTIVIADLTQLAYAHFTDPDAYSPSLLATPPAALPLQATTPTATPELPQMIVDNTGGGGLTLREAPGGAELMVLPEGVLVYLTETASASANGRTWREVRGPDNVTGWVVADYLQEP